LLFFYRQQRRHYQVCALPTLAALDATKEQLQRLLANLFAKGEEEQLRASVLRFENVNRPLRHMCLPKWLTLNSCEQVWMTEDLSWKRSAFLQLLFHSSSQSQISLGGVNNPQEPCSGVG